MNRRISVAAARPERALLMILILIAALFLSGCEQKQYSDADLKAQKDKARAFVQAYIDEADPGARITSMKELSVRPEVTNHKYYLTDFVTGTCSSEGKTYDFAVNTRTGEVFTSREYDAFQDAFCERILSELAIPADNYAVSMHTARTIPVSEEHPEYGEYPFRNLLPAVIPDMSEYAGEAVSGEDMSVYLSLAYLGAPMDFSGIRNPTEPLRPGASSVYNIYRLSDSEVEESEIAGFDMSFAPVFAAEVLRSEKGRVSFARYAFEESVEPFVLHYPREIVMISGDAFEGESRRVSFDGGPGGDFFLELTEPQRLAVHTVETEETEKLFSHVLLRDLAAADDIPQLLLKERSIREWYQDYYEWEQVSGTYVLSAYRSPERIWDGDIIVFGETGRALLEKQTKENEERMKQN